jgi:hypothetical protein
MRKFVCDWYRLIYRSYRKNYGTCTGTAFLFHLFDRTWENIKNSPFYMEYSRLLP